MQPGFFATFVAAGVVLLGSTVVHAQPAPEQPAQPVPPDAPEASRPAEESPTDATGSEQGSSDPRAAAEAIAAEDAEAAPPAELEEDPAQSNPRRFGDSFGSGTAAPGGASPEQPATSGGLGVTWPEPQADAKALGAQHEQGPQAADGEDTIFAEDWWSHARPILELHGYLRLRAELFHNFSLGRLDRANRGLWLKPTDNPYTTAGGTETVGASEELCTADEAGVGSDDTAGNFVRCKNKTQAGANLRFRLNPELHISDNVRIRSQIDLLDNLVLGSTPAGYRNEPAAGGGYQVAGRNGYTPFGYYDDTQVAPSSGINSFQDSIVVKRAWGEYETPLGELRFGRMPDHWGLGMLHNSGDGYDDDYQSTVDRIQFTTGIESLGLYVSGAWDFANEGATSGHLALPQAQAYDLAQLDDVDQYNLIIARKLAPQLVDLKLAKGELVINGGLYLTYRKQLLANDSAGDAAGNCSAGADALGCDPGDIGAGYVRRDAKAWIPDLWMEVLYKKFLFEAEVATIQGTIQSVSNTFDKPFSSYFKAPGGEGWKIRQWGVATRLQQRLVEDKLRLGFGFGWASGDADAAQNGAETGLTPGLDGLQQQNGNNTFSTFRFHPNYRVDQILHRNLLTRVQGTYYFRPSVEYDLMRTSEGQRLGGAFAAIWSRASQFVQTPGHQRDLGIELNGSVYFQAKDGALNDDPDTMGGFYTMLQYGILFPLSGMGYQPNEADDISNQSERNIDLEPAQILRWYLGVMF